MDKEIVQSPVVSFFTEAKQRWKADLPPFFVKAQKIGFAIVTFGGAIAGISIPVHSINFIIIGGTIAGIGTGLAAAAQFVQQASVILAPGDTLTNKTDEPAAVNVAPVEKADT